MISYLKLTLPSGQDVFDGGIIKLGQDPDTYFVKYGSYISEDSSQQGWYIRAVGSSVCIGVTDEILKDARVVSDGGAVVANSSEHSCCCNANPSKSLKLSQLDSYLLNSSYLVVRTIAERDGLPLDKISNGRVVRVIGDSDDSEIVDYQYDIEEMSWKPVDYTRLDMYKALSKDIVSLSNAIETLSGKLDKLIEGSQTVKE